MITRMAWKSLIKNPRMTAWSLMTLASCAALVTIFLIIYFEMPEKMEGALREQGANAVAYADPLKEGGKNGSESWDMLKEIAGKSGCKMLMLSAQVEMVKEKPVVIISADRQGLSEMTPYWSISGKRGMRQDECLTGRSIAEALGLKVQERINLRIGKGKSQEAGYQIAGIVDSGDDDDWKIFVPVSPEFASKESAGEIFQYALLSVPDGEKGIEKLNKMLDREKGSIPLKPLRQITHGEKIILKKVILLIGLSLVTVLILTSLGVSSAALARIAERKKEFSLMQSLGAKRRFVIGFLLLENIFVGTAASAIGSGAGVFLSYYLLRRMFHFPVRIHPLAFFMTAIVAVGISILTGCIAAGRALRIQPAIVLKGE